PPPPPPPPFPSTTLFRSGGEFQAGINSVTGTRRARKLAFFDFDWVTVSYSRGSRGWFWDSEREYRTTHTRSAVAAELGVALQPRSEEHTSELQSRSDLVC